MRNWPESTFRIMECDELPDIQPCLRKLYDQDDGEVSHCQLPKGHSRKQAHTPWPELRINKPEAYFSFPAQADKEENNENR